MQIKQLFKKIVAGHNLGAFSDLQATHGAERPHGSVSDSHGKTIGFHSRSYRFIILRSDSSKELPKNGLTSSY